MNTLDPLVESSVGGGEPVVADIRALGHRSMDARTNLDRAYTHLVNGDYDSAEMDYRVAICLNPVDENVRERLAKIGRVLCTMR